MTEKMQRMSLTYGSEDGACAVCGADGRACRRCGVDYYCGREHQTQDWPRHKQTCGCFEVREDAALGRHLVATRTIRAGTVLMRETPLVVFPSQVGSVARAACVGCGASLGAAVTLSTPRCEGCGWPVCGEACSQRPEHRPECAAFQRAGFKVQDASSIDSWCALGALRFCLAARQAVVGPRLLELQSDMPASAAPDPSRPDLECVRAEMDAALETFEFRRRQTVRYLTEEAGMAWLDPRDVRRAEGSLLINSITLEHIDKELIGAFAGLSLLEHACAPNAEVMAWATHNSVLGEGGGRDAVANMEHVLVAVRDIARGEHLSIAYRGTLFEGKAQRRKQLGGRWGFYCRCKLCEDPTQGGLYLDSWYCGHCKGRGERSLVRVDHGLLWRCGRCGRGGNATQPGGDAACKQAAELADRLRFLKTVDLGGVRVPASQWEALLRDALWPAGPLHPTSSTVLQARFAASEPPEDGDYVEAPTAAASALGAAHCRALLAALAGFCAGGHATHRALLHARLLAHLGHGIAATLRRAQACGSQADRQALLAEAEALREEGISLIPAMKQDAALFIHKKEVEYAVYQFACSCEGFP